MDQNKKWKKIEKLPFIEEVLKKSDSLDWIDIGGNVCKKHFKIDIKPKYSMLIRKEVPSEVKGEEHKSYYIYANKNRKKKPKLIVHGDMIYWLDLNLGKVWTAKIPYQDIRMDWRHLVVFLERPQKFF